MRKKEWQHDSLVAGMTQSAPAVRTYLVSVTYDFQKEKFYHNAYLVQAILTRILNSFSHALVREEYYMLPFDPNLALEEGWRHGGQEVVVSYVFHDPEIGLVDSTSEELKTCNSLYVPAECPWPYDYDLDMKEVAARASGAHAQVKESYDKMEAKRQKLHEEWQAEKAAEAAAAQSSNVSGP